MELFATENDIEEGSTEAFIETPFGRLIVRARYGGFDSSGINAGKTVRTRNGARVLAWNHADCRAELLLATLDLELPPDMSVDQCHAALWRLRARNGGGQPLLEIGWQDLPPEADGGADSGEGLDCLTWDIADAQLSIGTEDGEYLAARAARGDMMPKRFEPDLSIATVEYLDNGLRTPLPPLRNGEVCQAHFVTAWNKPKDEDDCSTGLVVACSPHFILHNVGLSYALP